MNVFILSMISSKGATAQETYLATYSTLEGAERGMESRLDLREEHYTKRVSRKIDERYYNIYDTTYGYRYLIHEEKVF